MTLEIRAETPLPTLHGTFRCLVFADPADPSVTHLALVRGEVDTRAVIPARVHSECFTGEVLHSVKCDCRRQVDAALDHIDHADLGVRRVALLTNNPAKVAGLEQAG